MAIITSESEVDSLLSSYQSLLCSHWNYVIIITIIDVIVIVAVAAAVTIVSFVVTATTTAVAVREGELILRIMD